MTTPPDPPPERPSEFRRLIHGAEDIERRVLPSWLQPSNPENRIPLLIAILAAVALQLAIPDRYGLRPRWLIPTLELVLLAVLTVLNPIRLIRATTLGKYASYALVAAITLDNGFSAGFLDHDILSGRASGDPSGLLATGAAIYLTNIVVFGIWYWELDRGGPIARIAAQDPYPDFLFPQMENPTLARQAGVPASSTTCTSASPMPSRSRRPTRCRCRAGPRP